MQNRNKIFEDLEDNKFYSLVNNKSIQEQQRDILLQAIDDYLTWRNNKDMPDNRGYYVTFLTKIRHYTSYGETRANNLKHALFNSRWR